MAGPRIDHIHVTVRDIERAERFYDALLPLLGFDLALKERAVVRDRDYRLVEYHHAAFSLGIVSERPQYSFNPVSRRRAGAMHHLAFRVDRPCEVDSVHDAVRRIPARVLHAPRYWPEYCVDYYAFFFKDSEGIEYEVASFARDVYFPV